MKIVLLTLLAAVVVSLFSGLFFLVKDKDSRRLDPHADLPQNQASASPSR